MITQFSRTELLIGAEGAEKLKNSRVAVFGLGGVGGYVVEALARAGVGTLDLVDNDVVSLSNINRQILALHSTIGILKTEAARQRLLDINPNLKIVRHNCFYLPETADSFDFAQYDYVADAIDTVAGKIALVQQAAKANTPIICAMGAGNKLNAGGFKVADISKTSVCPLAKVMRRELRKRGIDHFKVVYSEEPAITPQGTAEDSKKRQTPGSISYVPAVVGLMMAGEIIRDLLGTD
ncbi:MAG: tRNA threonylcarbamoyladenosine dehydratase [Alphaproteobacteria bacterium]|nr:tRNA threonylcarbamoyladenosine dehydratase [Alphaproteobacteria bacterium]